MKLLRFAGQMLAALFALLGSLFERIAYGLVAGFFAIAEGLERSVPLALARIRERLRAGPADRHYGRPFDQSLPAKGLLYLWFGLLAVFMLSPELDRSITHIFAAEHCLGGICTVFPARSSVFLNEIRHILQALPRWMAIAVLLMLLWRFFEARRQGRRIVDVLATATGRIQASVVAAALLGPILLVDAIIKRAVGRPRPDATLPFGGDEAFMPAGFISDGCSGNCSFVSGEGSGAALLILIALLAPERYRKPALWLAIATATFTAMLRVAFGRHFFSDVTLGLLLTVTVFSFVHNLLLRRFGGDRAVPLHAERGNTDAGQDSIS